MEIEDEAVEEENKDVEVKKEAVEVKEGGEVGRVENVVGNEAVEAQWL